MSCSPASVEEFIVHTITKTLRGLGLFFTQDAIYQDVTYGTHSGQTS